MMKQIVTTAALILMLSACGTDAASVTETAQQPTTAAAESAALETMAAESGASETAGAETDAAVLETAEALGSEPMTETESVTGRESSQIIAVVGEQQFPIVMNAGAAAEAFIARLPLTLSMSELNGNEKYYYMEQGLPAAAETVGTIQAGDLMLYGTDCLVLFYEGFPTSYRYTRLGRVEDPSGLAAALGSGSVEVTFILQ